jgi:hypothetical protein
MRARYHYVCQKSEKTAASRWCIPGGQCC